MGAGVVVRIDGMVVWNSAAAVVVSSNCMYGVVRTNGMTVTTGAETPVVFSDTGIASVRPSDIEPSTDSNVDALTTTAVSTSIVEDINRLELGEADTSATDKIDTLDVST